MKNKVNYFKPEDFYQYVKNITQVQWGQDPLTPAQRLSEVANAKLEREGRLVFTDPWDCSFVENEHSDSTALLINVQPLEQCNHPKEKVKQLLESGGGLFECECGKIVRPSGFEG